MLIRGDLVHCPNLGEVDILNDHLLEIDASGFVVHLASANSAQSQQVLRKTKEPPVLIPNGTFLLPTFCDLHLHAAQFLYQGTGLHLPLMKWLDEYAYQAEERLDSDPHLARRVYQRLVERLIGNGTGTVLLFGTIKEETNLILADVMQNAGIRAGVGKLSMDISTRPSYVEVSPEASVASAASFADKVRKKLAHLPPHRRLVEPIITPRFVPTCSDPLLDGLGRLSELKSLRIQSHLAEAHDQLEWVKRERGVDDFDLFDRAKLLTPRTIQAHCTFLDPSRLVSRGTAIAHCPLSNAYFSAKPFPLREALLSGVKVGLGTDIAGGYSVDIMNSMRQAVAVSRMREGAAKFEAEWKESRNTDNESMSLGIDWREALYLATRGGAIALNIPHVPGMFKIGAAFDAQCLKLFDGNTMSGVGALDFFDPPLTDEPDPRFRLTLEILEKWWCLGDIRNRVAVWVQGHKLL